MRLRIGTVKDDAKRSVVRLVVQVLLDHRALTVDLDPALLEQSRGFALGHGYNSDAATIRMESPAEGSRRDALMSQHDATSGASSASLDCLPISLRLARP